MRNLTKPSQYDDLKKALPGGVGTVFSAGTEQLELLTPAGDKVLLAVHTDGFLYVNGEPYGMVGMPPAKHAVMHNTVDGTDPLSPEMIGAASQSVVEEILSASSIAVQKADEAIEISAEGKRIAENANATATGIADTANMALITAENTIQIATQAKETANGIDAKATQALVDAAKALSTATSASQKSDNAVAVANGVDAKATKAMADASAAKKTAEGVDAKANQALSGVDTLSAELANSVFPGMLLVYSGPFHTDNVTPKHKVTGAVLANWKLCNGANGTPDLRNKFVRGADVAGAGKSGGVETHTHTTSGAIANTTAAGTIASTTPGNVGATTLTAAQLARISPIVRQVTGMAKNNPGNTGFAFGGIYITTNDYGGFSPAIASSPMQDTATSASGFGMTYWATLTNRSGTINSFGSSTSHTHASAAHTHAFTGTAHTHTFTGSNTGSTSNLPPYYTLCYIMKVA